MKEITRLKLYLYPLLILVAGLCLTFYISYLLETDFQNRRRAEFDYQARLQTEALQQKLDRNLAALETLRVYQITRNKIRPEGFKRFVNQLMRKPEKVKGIFWIPRLASDKLQTLPRSRLPPGKETQIQASTAPDSPTTGDKTSAIIYATGETAQC